MTKSGDEPPYLSFLFIHDFSFRLRVRLMSTFLSVFGGNARTSEEDNQYNFYKVYNYNNSFSAHYHSLTGSTQGSIFVNKDGKYLN